MPSLLFCGPKMAACGIVISIWGVIMLVSPGPGYVLERFTVLFTCNGVFKFCASETVLFERNS